jgi:O-antigen/teichoic acid export membrane protein
VNDEPRRLRRDVAWNLVPVVLLAVVGLGLNFLIGGWWGEAALGAFSLVTSAVFSFAVLGACGLQYSVLRAVAEDSNDRARVAAIVVGALVPNVAIATVTTGAFLLLRDTIGSWMDSRAVSEGMLWAAPGLFCFAINKVLIAVVNGLRRMRAFAVYTSLRYSLLGTGVVLARVLDVEASHLPVIWTFVEVTMLLALGVEVGMQVSFSLARGWVEWMRSHLDYGMRGVVAAIAFEVNQKLDVWLLGATMSDSIVGIYSMASALLEGAQQLGIAVQNNLNPVMAKSLASGRFDEVEALAKRTRRWFVPAIVGMSVLAAGMYPVIVPWLIGKDSFIGGAVPYAIMMAGVALASPYAPFSQVLLMASRPGWHTLLVLGTIAVNFAACSLLIAPFGMIGAAIAIASSVVSAAVLVRLIVRWRVGVRL